MSLRSRLASQTVVIFGARIAGAALIFVLQAFIARLWGAERLGDFLLVVAAINLITLVMPLGFQTVATYFAANYAAVGDRSGLSRFLVWSYGHIAIMAVVVFIFCAPIANWFGGAGQVIAELAMPLTLLAVANAIVIVNLEVLVGLKKPISGYLPESLGRPSLMTIAFSIAAALLNGMDALKTMLWIAACGYLIVALVQFVFVMRSVKNISATQSQKSNDLGRWWRFALPWALITLATDFFFDIDLLILAGHLDSTELAIFGVCIRIFALITFGITAVYTLVLPDMCEAQQEGQNKEALQLKIGEANLVAGAAALVLVASVAIGGHIALRIFGPDFATGAWPLVILSLALLARAVFGPASLVLSVLDRPSACLPAVAFGVSSLVLFNQWLVPSFGITGAAIAALAAVTLWSAALWFTALKVANIDVSIYPRIRQIVLNAEWQLATRASRQ